MSRRIRGVQFLVANVNTSDAPGSAPWTGPGSLRRASGPPGGPPRGGTYGRLGLGPWRVRAGDTTLGTLARTPTSVALHRRRSRRFATPSTGSEHHLITNAFEPPREPLGGAFGMLAVEVVTAVFAILAAIANNVIRDDQDPVRHRNSSLLHSATLCGSVEHRREKAVFFVGNGPGTLNQNAAQVAIPFARAPRETFARTFLRKLSGVKSLIRAE